MRIQRASFARLSASRRQGQQGSRPYRRRSRTCNFDIEAHEAPDSTEIGSENRVQGSTVNHGVSLSIRGLKETDSNPKGVASNVKDLTASTKSTPSLVHPATPNSLRTPNGKLLAKWNTPASSSQTSEPHSGGAQPRRRVAAPGDSRRRAAALERLSWQANGCVRQRQSCAFTDIGRYRPGSPLRYRDRPSDKRDALVLVNDALERYRNNA